MTHTIDIAPEIERRIQEEATRIGVGADDLIVHMLDRGFPVTNGTRKDITEEFKSLVEWWERDTWPYSSVEKIAMHPAYQRIIGLGQAAVPLILEELRQEPHHWFWALKAITGENPMNREHAGNMKLMTEDWLHWGAEKGYIQQAQ